MGVAATLPELSEWIYLSALPHSTINLITQGGTCHVCIRGCACHVFGSEISLESHFWGV